MITSLPQLIAQVESNGNQFACRIEPNYTPKGLAVNKLVTITHLSASTCFALCKMSWGLYQIMGDNLVNMGLMVSPIEFCSNAQLQDTFFMRYCEQNKIVFTLDDMLRNQMTREQFAKHYNGPGNVVNYAQRIIDVYNTSHKL